MAETRFQCPYCGRVGSTTRQIRPDSSARCPGCKGSFKIASDGPTKLELKGTIAATSEKAATTPPRLLVPVPVPPLDPALIGEHFATTPSRKRLKVAIGFGAATLLASISVGVGWFSLRGSAPAPVAPEVLTTEQVTARCEASIALVSAADSSGTGFLVGDGLLATNAHVIDSAMPDQIQVTFPAAANLDRGPMLGRVIYFDPVRDLAILRVSTRLQPLETASNHQFRRGQDVVVIGNPGAGRRSLEVVVSRGVLGSRVVEGAQAYYQLSGSVNPGNSGGPAIDLDGRVVGVVTLKASKQEGLAFCIPAPDLVRAIASAASQPESAAAEAGRRHLSVARETARNEHLMEILDRTDPGTWIAMVDLDRELTDDSPEATSTRALLAQVGQVYEEDRADIVSIVFKVRSATAKIGKPVRAGDILAGSIEWAPWPFLKRSEAGKFATYAGLYIKAHEERGTHQGTLAALRKSY